MATQTLSLISQPVGNRSAVLRTLARQKAIRAIKEQLRAQGLRLAQFSSREIHIRAEQYLEVHRQELIEQAIETVSNSRSYASSMNESSASFVQNSGHVRKIMTSQIQ
jgi:hypothetical protein